MQAREGMMVGVVGRVGRGHVGTAWSIGMGCVDTPLRAGKGGQEGRCVVGPRMCDRQPGKVEGGRMDGRGLRCVLRSRGWGMAGWWAEHMVGRTCGWWVEHMGGGWNVWVVDGTGGWWVEHGGGGWNMWVVSGTCGWWWVECVGGGWNVWVVGRTGGWAGGSRLSVGAGMHHTSWRVMHHSCLRMMCHKRDDGRHGSTNGQVHDM